MTAQTTEHDTKTQRGHVLRWLRVEPQCGTEFLNLGIPRYSARIYELRKAGHQIIRRTCDVHSYHRSRQFVYELVP